MSKLKFLIYFPVLLGPIVSFAQSNPRDVVLVNDSVAYASIFAGDLSLLLSIVIGIIATFYVFRSANKMGGGLFGSVLKYIGVGMSFIVLGTVSIVFDFWFVALWFGIVNTTCFALGYIFVVIGAGKLLRGIMSN